MSSPDLWTPLVPVIPHFVHLCRLCFSTGLVLASSYPVLLAISLPSAAEVTQ
jgi:hypothetical protein